jgi:hypothetical protein
MSDNQIVGSLDQQRQTILSEAADTSHINQPTIVEPINVEPGTVNIPEENEQAQDTSQTTLVLEEYEPTNFASMLRNLTKDAAIVRLTLKPRLHFIVNLFSDSMQQDIEATPNFKLGNQAYNILQPLAKYNERSGRIGFLREPLRKFTQHISDITNSEERVVVSGEKSVLPVDMLVSEVLTAADAAIYGDWPFVDGAVSLPWTVNNSSDISTAVPASEYIRVSTLIDTETNVVDVQDHGMVSLDVHIHFIVHMRIPCLIRSNQDKFDRNLITHFKFLENSGIQSGLPTTISAAFRAKDIAYDSSVHNAFNLILEKDENATVVSFRDAAEGEEILGIGTFSPEDYEDSLFNGGDFLVSFNLSSGE